MAVEPAVNPARSYRSPLRAAQAQATRRRLLETARRLFVERGYAGTTVAAVATEAGVAPETVYLTVRGKRGLLEGVVEAAISDESGRPVQQQRVFADLERLPTPRARLHAYVTACCELLARTSPVHAVIRGAADRETFAVELRKHLLQQRLTDVTSLLPAVVGDSLRSGLSAEDAAQRFCALMSPELHHLLTVELGWTPSRYEQWLTALLQQELLSDL